MDGWRRCGTAAGTRLGDGSSRLTPSGVVATGCRCWNGLLSRAQVLAPAPFEASQPTHIQPLKQQVPDAEEGG